MCGIKKFAFERGVGRKGDGGDLSGCFKFLRRASAHSVTQHLVMSNE